MKNAKTNTKQAKPKAKQATKQSPGATRTHVIGNKGVKGKAAPKTAKIGNATSKTAPKAEKGNAKAQDRCRHTEAVQFTGSDSRWCPDCGAAYACHGNAATGEGSAKLRWKSPRSAKQKPGPKATHAIRTAIRAAAKRTNTRPHATAATLTKRRKRVVAKPAEVTSAQMVEHFEQGGEAVVQ